MQTSHLHAGEGSIRCTRCGKEFEVWSEVLENPIRLLDFKEDLAVKHTCQTAVHNQVRVMRPLDDYFSGMMRKMMRA
jgi:hypothetical protein